MTKIEHLRKSAELSTAELSRRSGVPRRTLDDWEHERRKPRDIYQLKKVADALGCKIEDLIEWE